MDRADLLHLPLCSPRQPLVEMTRKSIAVRLREGWWAAADMGTGAHRIHEVSHHQDAADGIG